MHVPLQRVFLGSPAIVVLQDSEPAESGSANQPRTGVAARENSRSAQIGGERGRLEVNLVNLRLVGTE
jgi:hypothetical protein